MNYSRAVTNLACCKPAANLRTSKHSTVVKASWTTMENVDYVLKSITGDLYIEAMLFKFVVGCLFLFIRALYAYMRPIDSSNSLW